MNQARPSTQLRIGSVFPRVDQIDFTGPLEVFSRIPNAVCVTIAKERGPLRDARGLLSKPSVRASLSSGKAMKFIPVPTLTAPMRNTPSSQKQRPHLSLDRLNMFKQQAAFWFPLSNHQRKLSRSSRGRNGCHQAARSSRFAPGNQF